MATRPRTLVLPTDAASAHRSWTAQVRYFARFYRNVTWNHRGYPPSDDPPAYSQEHPVADLLALLTAQGLAGVAAESDIWFFAGAVVTTAPERIHLSQKTL